MSVITPVKTINLFLADDDMDDAFVFQDILAGIDPSIHTTLAANGQEALDKLTEPGAALPDIIFLDLNMPRMGGKECMAALKKDRFLKHVPVIIYTTSSYSKDIEETLNSGAICFITKPSSLRELKEILSAICSNIHNNLEATLLDLSRRETGFVVC